jgi:hypothetical protein
VAARRTATGEVDVELVADPLAMAHAAASLVPADPADAAAPGTASSPREASRRSSVVFGAERRVRLAAAARIAILDERGNRLLELEPAAATAPAAAALAPSVPPAVPTASGSPPGPDSPPSTRRWLIWAIPTGVFALGAAGFGIASIASYGRAQQIAFDSGEFHLSDAQDNVRRGRLFAWITAGAGAAAAACAIPAAIYLARDVRHRRLTAAPTVAPGELGLVLAGRF